MKASEAIDQLKVLINKHGDLPLALSDPDTSWILPIEIEFSKEDEDQEGDMILITSSYWEAT